MRAASSKGARGSEKLETAMLSYGTSEARHSRSRATRRSHIVLFSHACLTIFSENQNLLAVYFRYVILQNLSITHANSAHSTVVFFAAVNHLRGHDHLSRKQKITSTGSKGHVCGLWLVGCRSVIIMIDDSEKFNRKLGFELQSLSVIERLCNGPGSMCYRTCH